MLNWNAVDADKEESGSDTDPFDNFDEGEDIVDDGPKRFAVGFEQAMGVLFPDEEASVLVEGLQALNSLLLEDAAAIRGKLLRFGLMPLMDLLEVDNRSVVQATLACLNNILYLPLPPPRLPSPESPMPASATLSSPISTTSPNLTISTTATASPTTFCSSCFPPSSPFAVANSNALLSPRTRPTAMSWDGKPKNMVIEIEADETCKEMLEALISLGLLPVLATFADQHQPMATRCEAAIALKFVCLHSPSAFLSGGLRTAVKLLKGPEMLAEIAIDCISRVFEVSANKSDLCRLCCKVHMIPPIVERLTLFHKLPPLLPSSPPPSPPPPPPQLATSATVGTATTAITPIKLKVTPPASSSAVHARIRTMNSPLNSGNGTPTPPPPPLPISSPFATLPPSLPPLTSDLSKDFLIPNSAALEAATNQRETFDRKVVYSTIILNLLDVFAASSSRIKSYFARHDVQQGLIRVLPCVAIPLKKIILRTIRQLVMDAMTLAALDSAQALPSDIMSVLVEHIELQDRDIKGEAIRTIYCLTSFNQKLQLSAAQAGVVPYLASFIWANDHLSAFALPILFHVATPTKDTSAAIQATGALDLLFALLKHQYHRIPALACIAQWVKVDPSIESVVLKDKNLESLSRAFRETKLVVQFEKLLESINTLVIVSDGIPAALAVDLAFREELMSRLRTTTNNAVRISLLKILAPLLQLMPAPQGFIEETQLLPLLATLSKDESSSIVQKLATLIFELASGLAKVSTERRRTLVANAEGRTSKRVPKAAASWQPNESSVECNVCHARFSIFNRRHHCRRCGALICSKCSANRRPQGDGMVRMCDQCVLQVDGEKLEKNSSAPTARKNAPHYSLPVKGPNFEIGETVEVFGLTNNSSYNGQKGTVSSSPGGARYEIQLTGSKEIVRFKAANLKKVERARWSEF